MNLKMEQRTYRIKTIEKLLGSIPKDLKIFTKYVQNKYYADDEEDQDRKEEKEMQKEMEKKLLPDGEGETGFYTDPDGVYLMDYHIKGFLKEAGNVLKDQLKIKALKSKIDNFVFIEPRYIWLKEHPDGRLERSIRAETPKGPRTSLVSSDYIDEGVEFEITITLLPHKEITWEVIEALLDYGKLKGLGQWRNGGYGRFVWKRVK